MRLLFDQDPERGEKYVIDAEGLYLDYSKNHVTDETVHNTIELAKARNLRQQIDAMFSGEKINTTEKRAVLHVALRSPRNASIKVDGHNVIPDVHEVLDKMSDFANGCAAARGQATPANASKMSSISASAAPTMGPVMA